MMLYDLAVEFLLPVLFVLLFVLSIVLIIAGLIALNYYLINFIFFKIKAISIFSYQIVHYVANKKRFMEWAKENPDKVYKYEGKAKI